MYLKLEKIKLFGNRFVYGGPEAYKGDEGMAAVKRSITDNSLKILSNLFDNNDSQKAKPNGQPEKGWMDDAKGLYDKASAYIDSYFEEESQKVDKKAHAAAAPLKQVAPNAPLPADTVRARETYETGVAVLTDRTKAQVAGIAQRIETLSTQSLKLIEKSNLMTATSLENAQNREGDEPVYQEVTGTVVSKDTERTIIHTPDGKYVVVPNNLIRR